MTVETDDLSVPVPGGELFVRRWRVPRSTQPPIVLLHDSLGCVELWRDLPEALALATSRDVIAYDRLGFGRSSARSAPISHDFIREEAAIYFPALVRALNVDRYVAFGHSVGGGMALTIAALDGDGSSCAAVITESAQALVEERTREGIRAAQAGFADAGRFARLTRLHGDKAQWVLDAWTQTWLSPQYATWNLDDTLRKVRCPVLVLHGDRDEFGSVESPKRIAGLVAGRSQLAILSDCGHVPHREKESEVLERVSAFLGTLG